MDYHKQIQTDRELNRFMIFELFISITQATRDKYADTLKWGTCKNMKSSPTRRNLVDKQPQGYILKNPWCTHLKWCFILLTWRICSLTENKHVYTSGCHHDIMWSPDQFACSLDWIHSNGDMAENIIFCFNKKHYLVAKPTVRERWRCDKFQIAWISSGVQKLDQVSDLFSVFALSWLHKGWGGGSDDFIISQIFWDINKVK